MIDFMMPLGIDFFGFLAIFSSKNPPMLDLKCIKNRSYLEKA